MVCANHDDSILLASVCFEQDWARISAKEAGGLTLLRTSGKGDTLLRGELLGKLRLFFCCFLLCLDIAV